MTAKKLHEIIHDNADRIVDVFVRKARRHDLPPRHADQSQVVDDLNEYVRKLGIAYQSGQEAPAEVVAKAHGQQRWYAGYDLRSVLLEYGVLRSVIGEIVEAAGYQMTIIEADRIAQLINVSLAEAAVEFTTRATEQVNQALNAANAAARAREDIVAVVSHDLKNPLNVIYGSLSLIESTLKTADDLQAARADLSSLAARMRRAATRMNRLITDLLDLARIR